MLEIEGDSALAVFVSLVKCVSDYEVHHFGKVFAFLYFEFDIGNALCGGVTDGHARFFSRLPLVFIGCVGEKGNLVVLVVGPVLDGAVRPSACIAVQRFIPFHHLVVHKSGGGRCFCVIPALAARKIPHNAEATVLIAIGRVILDTVIVRVYSTGPCSCVHSELHLRMSVRTDFRHFILRAGCYQQSGK